MAIEAGWDARARAMAAQRWRAQSAAMGQPTTEALVVEAQIAPGMQVLDVACGTGEPGISIAAQLQGSGAVVGVDISPAPLAIATERARERGLANISFQQGDVHALPFPDAAFDRVTCRLGVMFFGDCARALAEIRRVLKPGGRVSLLAWGPVEQPYFGATIGTIRRLVAGNLPAAGAVMFRFAEPGTLSAALRGAGFERITEELRTVAWSWPGAPEDVWAYFQEVTVPFRPLLDAVPAARRAEVDAAVLEEIRRYYDGARVNFTARVVLASAFA